MVEVYEPDGLEVEFVTASGRSAALVTLNDRDVRPDAPGERDEHCKDCKDRKRRGVQPRPEERPAAGRGLLDVDVHERDDRRDDKRGEPQARGEEVRQA